MFRSLVARLRQNQLVSHSAVFFIGTVLANVGNYFFHLLMARLLGVEEYGDLQSLLSLLVILSIPFAVINTVVVNYAAPLKAAGQTEKLRQLWRWTNGRLLVVGGLFGLVIAALAAPISNFLQLSSVWSVVSIGVSGAMTLVIVANRAFLQGKNKFSALSVNIGVEVIVKLISAVILVWLGWRLMGAVSGILIGSIAAYAVSFLPLKNLWVKSVAPADNHRDIFNYSGPVFVSRVCLILLYTLDVILAKHFLTPAAAGYYSGLVILGRMCFFLSSPIVAVMFSLGSAQRTNNSQIIHRQLVWQALGLTGLISLGVIASYLLLPKLFVYVLLGAKFYDIMPYLWPYALLMASYSLINVLAHAFLSVHQLRFILILVGGVIMETVGLLVWHGNFASFLWVINIVMGVVLIGLTVEFIRHRPVAPVAVTTAPVEPTV